jgi:hypothetical protein
MAITIANSLRNIGSIELLQGYEKYTNSVAFFYVEHSKAGVENDFRIGSKTNVSNNYSW